MCMLIVAVHMQIQSCPIKSTHPWERCCYAHPHENARRRDPRQYRYIAEPCPDYKRGICLLVTSSSAAEACRARLPLVTPPSDQGTYSEPLCSGEASCTGRSLTLNPTSTVHAKEQLTRHA